MISSVRMKTLKTNCDERGRLFEILRRDDELFSVFGQAYVTTAFPGVVKAWHLHRQQTDNMCVIHGSAKFVLYDPREESPTKGEINEFFLCDDNRVLLQIPQGVYHGLKNIGIEELYVLNLPTNVYNHDNPDEYRLDPYDNDIPYDWACRNG